MLKCLMQMTFTEVTEQDSPFLFYVCGVSLAHVSAPLVPEKGVRSPWNWS